MKKFKEAQSVEIKRNTEASDENLCRERTDQSARFRYSDKVNEICITSKVRGMN